MQKQKQHPTFFDRKIYRHGYGKALSITKLLPQTWQYVRIYIIAKNENTVTLKIQKLYAGENNAHNKKTSKTNK